MATTETAAPRGAGHYRLQKRRPERPEVKAGAGRGWQQVSATNVIFVILFLTRLLIFVDVLLTQCGQAGNKQKAGQYAEYKMGYLNQTMIFFKK